MEYGYLVAKIINIDTGKEVIPDRVPEMVCTICTSPFHLQDEGGTCGYFGLIPVQFCPFCLSSLLDMARQLVGKGEDDEKDD